MRRVSLCLLLAASSVFVSDFAFASFLPPNNLHLQDNIHTRDANISEAMFHQIVNEIVDVYQPYVQAQGATLKANNNWQSSTVNALANRYKQDWTINMYGGLARRSEITPDGFAMVVCHELGHHFGGFPRKNGSVGKWAASEGQSDYWATQSCSRTIWGNDFDVNRTHAATVDAVAKGKCNQEWAADAERFLCYRIANASYSAANLLAALNGFGKISYSTPDRGSVSKTFVNHPQAQCRLDTYFAGALCTKDFDDARTPNTEAEQAQQSCFAKDGYKASARPRCWFAPSLR